MQDINSPRRPGRRDNIVAPRRPTVFTPGRRPSESQTYNDDKTVPEEDNKDVPEKGSTTPSALGSLATAANQKPKSQGIKAFLKRIKPRNRKQWIIAGLIAVLLLAAAGGGLYLLLNKQPVAAPVVKKSEPAPPPPPKPTTVPSRLTGVQVTPELNSLPVTGIIIENSPDARPQAGLNEAGVVYEAIAEGGITRFLALYQETQPTNVGPVRSARPYYLEWLQPFDASIAHVGGSPDALAQIRSQGIKDLDQFVHAGAYRRSPSRAAPHNVYSGVNTLYELGKGKGYTTSNFNGFPRKAEKPAPAITAKSIDLTISSPLYNVHYDYDPAANNYHRSMGGSGHMDENTKTLIKPKVVIAIITSQGIHPDGQHTTYATNGASKAVIFQDGAAQVVTWKKASTKDQIQFVDEAGQPVTLNPGQTWITVVGDAARVLYKP